MSAPDSTPANDPTWDTEELRRDFDVVGFSAPFVVVVRKADGVKGSLEFGGGFGGNGPRLYFGFRPDA